MDVRHVFAQTNRFSAAIRKLLSIKGEEHEVSYGVHLEDERPEHSFIKGERLWVQTNQVTSAAGTLPVIGVSNPVPTQGQGMLVVITNVFCYSSIDQIVSLRWAQNFTHVLGGGMWSRDGRWAKDAIASVTTTARLIAQTPAAAGGDAIFAQLPCVTNVVQDFMVNVGRVPPVVLYPGNQLFLSGAAVGVQTLTATFAGYERSLESGEIIP